MRGGEGLVQIDVHCIDAQVARTNFANYRVKVRAITINQPASFMDRV